MDRAFSTLRRRRTCVVNPTAKTDVSGRQVAKLMGSSSGRQSRERALAAFMSFRAMARFRDERKGVVRDDDIDGETAELRVVMPEATKPLDGVSVSLDSDEREMIIVTDGREHRVPVGKGWSFC